MSGLTAANKLNGFLPTSAVIRLLDGRGTAHTMVISSPGASGLCRSLIASFPTWVAAELETPIPHQ